MSLADSPFINRLHTNYVPLDSEVLEIRSLLVDPANELARLDAQIKEAEIALDQLKKQRALLKLPIDAHLALISPMRRIPQDVLLEIFFSCLPTEHNALVDPAEAPLVLGRICRHWREVAYSVPMLWSSIHIPSLDYSTASQNILSSFERTVKAWLERSAPCPLSISFFDKIHPRDILKENPLEIQLPAVSRRLRHLALAGHSKFIPPLLRLGAADLPLLRRLRIRTTIDITDFTNVFQIPTLEDVALAIFTPVNPLSLGLPWSQLTRLCLNCFPVWTENGSAGGLDVRGVSDVLRMCPNLVHCEIRVTRESDEGLPPDTPPISLPHLDTLFLSNWNLRSRILAVPNLRFLRIGDVYSRKASTLPPNGCLSADIDPNQFTSPDWLRSLLYLFPTISHLRLSSVTQAISPDDLALFCPPHNLCPMLTHFTTHSPAAEFSDAAVLAFIQARMAMPTPLQQFRAHFQRPMEIDIVPELHSFIADGLEVALEYSPSSEWVFDSRSGLHDIDFSD
ncbi:hypothetical protein MSAN_01055100 [Mycena sanguinolenta]|uniref:F-box domain-containing protein n=1 Tax=Mycena sanguinolenta TaxID=230812 RepID=A0A8H6YTC7_9AGAR|nr:hypothetical protein MSAN_01055100 [Mycena sanguinolenta]